MFIILNPEKCHRFVTKGINLFPKSPFAEVPLGLESEFLARIDAGLQKGEIRAVESEEEIRNLTVENQAAISMDKDSDEKVVGTIGMEDNEDGKRCCVLTLTSDDPEENSRPRQIIQMPSWEVQELED